MWIAAAFSATCRAYEGSNFQFKLIMTPAENGQERTIKQIDKSGDSMILRQALVIANTNLK
jgi:hypothetical protein